MISPLFSSEEARVLLRWLDTVGPRDVSDEDPPSDGTAELIERLKELVGMWAIDPKMVIV